MGGDTSAIARHLVAVSTDADGVHEFGIDSANMFPLWDWVGGRYSLDAAVGLSLMIGIGPENFAAMLAGMHEVDQHFRSTPLERNIPVLMGLLSIWYNNFLGAQAGVHLHPGTATRWTRDAGGDWSRYAASVAYPATTDTDE